MKIIVFALAFAFLGCTQEQTLEERIAAAEKREAAASVALNKPMARYTAEVRGRPPRSPFDEAFEKEAEWLEASRELSDLRFEKIRRDMATAEKEHKVKMNEIAARKAEAAKNFCESSAKALADDKTPEMAKGTLRDLREHFDCK
jgi:hypothetical protein